MKIILAIVVIAIMVGCTAPEPTPIEPVAPVAPPPVPDPVPDPIPEPVVTEPEVCDLDQDALNIVEVKYSFSSEGLTFLDDGFTFTFIPLDDEGNIIPAEGNLGVAIYWTENIGSERKSRSVVYEQGKYIKPENVNSDCSPQPIVVKFQDIEKDSRYEGVDADDPGFMKVIFKKVGSFEEYSAVYTPAEGERLFP